MVHPESTGFDGGVFAAKLGTENLGRIDRAFVMTVTDKQGRKGIVIITGGNKN